MVLQAGGEVTDFIIVLRTNSAIKTFSGNAHLSVGAGLSAAVGIVGRAAEADIRAGDGGYAACYTYSCSKGTSHFTKVLAALKLIRQLIFSALLTELGKSRMLLLVFCTPTSKFQ